VCLRETKKDNLKKKVFTKTDDRAVMIYARKSKISHKGNSIANQEDYCREYGIMSRVIFNVFSDKDRAIYENLFK
jgi:hypothetical protein